MDKNLGFGFTLLPAQIQVVNGLLHPRDGPDLHVRRSTRSWGSSSRSRPLRKIGIGLFVIASVVPDRVVDRGAHPGRAQVSVWWQILAYAVLTASEVLVSITALEFSYKQAPLRMKSFIMALFLLAVEPGQHPHRRRQPRDGAPRPGRGGRGRRRDVGQARRRERVRRRARRSTSAETTGLTVTQGRQERAARPGRSSSPRRIPAGNAFKLMDSVERKPVAERRHVRRQQGRGLDLQARRARSTSTSSRCIMAAWACSSSSSP